MLAVRGHRSARPRCGRTTTETSTFAFSGGFLVASLAAGAVVLGCAVAPRSLAVRLLELPPLPQWGRISYGVYLWYWPVLLVMTGPAAALGCLPALPGPGGHHGRHRGDQLRPRRDADPPRRAASTWRSWIAAPDRARPRPSARCFVSTLVPVGGDGAPGLAAGVTAVPSTTHAATATVTSPTAPATAALDDVDDADGAADAADADDDDDDDHHGAVVPLAGPARGEGHAKPVKVLLVGDSVAGSLGVGLAARGAAVRRADRERGDARVLAVDAGRDQGPLLHGAAGRAL